MKLPHPISINVKPSLNHYRWRIQRCGKYLLSMPKFVFVIVALLLLLILSKYWDNAFSTSKIAPYYSRPTTSFWGHLHEGEKVREIVCSRLSKDCFAVVDQEQDSDSIMRYLYTEKIGTYGYLTRAHLQRVDGQYLVVKDDIVSAYVRGMVLAPFATNSISDTERDQSVLIIGLGGGAMNNYFSSMEHQPKVTVVEIDPTIYYLSKQWFGSAPSKFQEFIVEDAVTFVQNRSSYVSKTPTPNEKETLSNLQYDAILIDCSGNEDVDNLVSPIPQFLDPKLIGDIKTILKPMGVVTVNVVSLNAVRREHILIKPYEVYKQFFENCFYFRALLNYVLVCTDNQEVDGNSYSGFEELIHALPEDIQYKLAQQIEHQPYYRDSALQKMAT